MRVLKRGVCLTQKLNRPLACSYLPFLSPFLSCALNAGVLKADQTVKRNSQELLEQLCHCDSVPSIRWKFHLRCCKVRVSLRRFIFLEGFFFFFRNVKNTSSSLPFRCWLKSPPKCKFNNIYIWVRITVYGMDQRWKRSNVQIQKTAPP